MTTFSRTPVPFPPLAEPRFVSCGATAAGAAAAVMGDCEFLSCGRDALFRISSLLGGRRALWLPTYFCPAVVRGLSGLFDLKFFVDFPSEASPRFETLKPRAGELVLAVNFFGLRDRRLWEAWRAQNPGVLLAEDHTHAPFSDWAADSSADYAFASLRKYLPIPDGAYLRGAAVSPAPLFRRGAGMADFAADALAAASLLALRGEWSQEAEDLYYRAEAKLNARKSASRISSYSLALLRWLDIGALESARGANMSAFLSAWRDRAGRRLVGAKFCPLVKFDDRRACASACAKLSEAGVRLPVYWGGFGRNSGAELLDEAQTLVSVPLDFRHSPSDAAKLAALLS